MPTHTSYYVQSFIKKGRGIGKGEMLALKTEHEAVRRGEKLVPKSLGVAVFSVVGDSETGETEEPIMIKTWGEVPEDP